MTREFAGVRAVVTGGSNGIGRAVVEALTVRGADVVNLDVEPGGEGVTTLRVDLSDAAALERAVARVLDGAEVGVLVNCAGISEGGPLREFDQAVYDRVLAVNLHAPVALMRRLGTAMADAGGGRIVNVTSVHASVSEPGFLAYDIAKAGLEAATRSVAVELAACGVLVNAVAPGFVATRMALVDGVDELDRPESRSIYVDAGQLPLRRSARASEIAEAIVWLSGPANTYLTGQTLTVDGGLTVRL